MASKNTNIDWQLCLKRASNDPEIARTILTMFIADLDEAFPEIRKAWEEEQYSVLKTCIHKLAGGSCYTGTPRIAAVLGELNIAINSSPHSVLLGSLFRQFTNAYRALHRHFDKNTFEED
ncbi:MAG: chemotaxis protein CheY [Gammaproteobacteria bacterium]|jgi:two-component system sensor histidine kinase BarA|nr:chemotaxis protein CheY [Gammaproteobacteria bacterium]